MTQIAGWTLVHFVWEGGAIAVACAIALRLLARGAANARYLVACAGLAAMLVAPVGTAVFLSMRPMHAPGERARVDGRNAPPVSPIAAHADLATQGADAHGSRADRLAPIASTVSAWTARLDPVRVMPMVVGFWLLGVALLVGRMVAGWWCVRDLQRSAIVAAPSPWQPAAERIAARLGLGRAVRVVESVAVDVPVVLGWLQPAILLPVAALAHLTPSQVEAILAHELAHVRRHDYLVNLLQTIAETLLFYQPGVWWVSARIRAEREHCCDEVAVRVSGDALGYARALTALETWRSAATPLALAATDGSLLERVRRILRVPIDEQPRAGHWSVTLALTALLAAGAGGWQRVPVAVARAGERAAAVLSARVLDQADGVASPGPGVGDAPRIAGSIEEAPPPTPPQAPEPPPAPVLAGGTGPLAVPQPPAPPGVPAPPAPPAPPEPGLSLIHNGTFDVQWSDGRQRMDASGHGDIVFTDDLTDVRSISGAGYLKLRMWSGLVPHTVEIRNEHGTLTREYYVAGVERPWTDEAQRLLAEQLPLFVRRSGFAAETRTRQILAAHGVSGVLDEIARLESDFARRRYFKALFESTTLTASDMTRALALARQLIRSAFELSQTLVAAAPSAAADQATASAYVAAADAIKSDFEHRRALVALLDARPASSGTANLALRSAASIASDFEKRAVLTRAMNESQLSVDDQKALLESIGKVSSDFECSTTLVAFVEKYGVASAIAGSFFRAAGTLDSDFERRRTLDAVIAKGTSDPAVLEALVGSAGNMHSDFDRAEILVALARSQPIEGPVRTAFLHAADGIASSFHQNRVLAALVRSERR